MALTNDVTQKLVDLVHQVESGEKSHQDVMDQLCEKRSIPKESRSLSALEAHMLDCINQNKAANATHIAKQLGITRGGVSKIATRLLKRGMIEKYQLEGNRKEVYYKLTPLGKKLDAAHTEMHEQLMDELNEVVSDYSEEDRAKLLLFLDKVMQII